MSNKELALDIIEANEGDSIAVLRAKMTLDGISPKDASAAIKEAKEDGLLSSNGSGNGFNGHFYFWLTEGARSPSEVQTFINTNGTDKSVKHSSH